MIILLEKLAGGPFQKIARQRYGKEMARS